jgi:NAD(P)-dependent dehydrogenase (short-subunit alcohol dehydrogenase family)
MHASGNLNRRSVRHLVRSLSKPELKETHMARTNQRIALVTGANKGIGLEIARQIAQAGVKVLVGARNAERGQAAAEALAAQGLDATFQHIDLTDAASAAAAAAHIDATFGRLDILVNNAGVVDAKDGPPGAASVDAARRIFDTNFFGTLSVTQAMLPLLKKSAAGRIVNLSSSLGSVSMNGDPAWPYYSVRLIGYNASKAALNMLTVQLSAELRGTPITVNSVCPGHVDTDLSSHMGKLTPTEGARTAVRLALAEDSDVSGQFIDANGNVAW